MKTGQTSNLRPDEIYHEEVPFTGMVVLVIFLAILSLGSLGLFLYTVIVGPIGSKPAPAWIFLFEFALMGSVTIFMLNFRRLIISMTYDGIRVGYGSIGKTISWSDIASYQRATGTSLSGGLHFGPTRRGMGAAYTVLGKPAVTLTLRSGTIREITFSTDNPEEVMSVIRDRTGINSGTFY